MPHGDVWRRKGMPKDEEHTIERGTNGDKVGIFQMRAEEKKAAMKDGMQNVGIWNKESQVSCPSSPF